jgi:hypothetical protein
MKDLLVKFENLSADKKERMALESESPQLLPKRFELHDLQDHVGIFQKNYRYDLNLLKTIVDDRQQLILFLLLFGSIGFAVVR